jgi:hypothetical protein
VLDYCGASSATTGISITQSFCIEASHSTSLFSAWFRPDDGRGTIRIEGEGIAHAGIQAFMASDSIIVFFVGLVLSAEFRPFAAVCVVIVR